MVAFNASIAARDARVAKYRQLKQRLKNVCVGAAVVSVVGMACILWAGRIFDSYFPIPAPVMTKDIAIRGPTEVMKLGHLDLTQSYWVGVAVRYHAESKAAKMAKLAKLREYLPSRTWSPTVKIPAGGARGEALEKVERAFLKLFG